MTLRTIPPDFDSAVVTTIDTRLDAVEREHNVRILLAIESGSRAWGFPSPDSDYDCRFIFVRRQADYLSLWPKRDVIETPLDKVLDINGWDLGKALKLMLKGNAVVLEWLRSPVVYRGDPAIRDDLLALAMNHADRGAIGRHYLHLGERQRRTYFGDGKTMALKKLFYALRPAAALRWLSVHSDRAVPPMHFPTLLAECDPPEAVKHETAILLEHKAQTREMGNGSLPPTIAAFIDREFEAANEVFGGGKDHVTAKARADADALFRRVTR